MRKFLTYLAFLSMACTAATAFARQHGGGVEDDPHPHSFQREKFHGGVALKQDTFFGFQTILDAGYEIWDNIDFTFYTWLWTNPNFGRSQILAVPDPQTGEFGNTVIAGGTGLWTEVGAGLNFRLLNDTLSINPQIGMLNGALLSSNVVGQNIRAGEGVVPNITINYDDEFFTAEGYFAYYMATREDRPRDFIHNWVNAGFRPGLFNFKNVPISSIGAHWEHLWLFKNRLDRDNTGTVYNWIGPYIEFALPMNLALRFAGGFDLKGDVSGDFYQATVKLDF